MNRKKHIANQFKDWHFYLWPPVALTDNKPTNLGRGPLLFILREKGFDEEQLLF